eukprot:3540719-Prymnesium_polylepis.1
MCCAKTRDARGVISEQQGERVRRASAYDAQASFSQDMGVLRPARACMSFSIGSVMERSPFRPMSSSMSERFISKS